MLQVKVIFGFSQNLQLIVYSNHLMTFLTSCLNITKSTKKKKLKFEQKSEEKKIF